MLHVRGDRRRRSSAVVITALMMPGLLLGCGGSQSEADTTELEPVDPRFASPEAATAHFNDVMGADQLRSREFIDMFHAENHFQRRMLEVIELAMPVIDLATDVERRFEAPLFPDSDDMVYKPIMEPAVLDKVEAQRAEGEYVDELGDTIRLYLVKVDREWRVSGYTIEYDMDEQPEEAELDAISELLNGMGQVAEDIHQRLRRGEFESAEDVRAAYTAALMGYAMQYPDRFERLRAAIEADRSPFAEGGW